jgi:hypothetical protein
VASAISDITAKYVLEYKQSIIKSLKDIQAVKEKDLSQLQVLLETSRNNMIQSNMFLPAEIESGLQIHHNKIVMKRA